MVTDPPPSINQTALSYDLQGNLTDNGEKLYVWDIAGRLRQVKDKATQQVIETYDYDPYGRRTTKVNSDGAFRYYYDGWRVIEERFADAWSARNVWGLYLDETVVRTSIPDAKDYYPVLNPIYSPLRVYDGNCALVARARYTPYGRPTLVDSGGSPVSPDFPHLFTGQRLNPLTGMYYYKNRFVMPRLGRFLSMDPWRRISEGDVGLRGVRFRARKSIEFVFRGVSVSHAQLTAEVTNPNQKRLASNVGDTLLRRSGLGAIFVALSKPGTRQIITAGPSTLCEGSPIIEGYVGVIGDASLYAYGSSRYSSSLLDPFGEHGEQCANACVNDCWPPDRAECVMKTLGPEAGNVYDVICYCRSECTVPSGCGSAGVEGLVAMLLCYLLRSFRRSSLGRYSWR